MDNHDFLEWHRRVRRTVITVIRIAVVAAALYILHLLLKVAP